jgi:20S proteasome subunit alpha 3
MRANLRVVEFATVGQTKAGTIYHHLWDGDAINDLLKEHGLAKPPTDEETTEQALGNAGMAEARGETTIVS